MEDAQNLWDWHYISPTQYKVCMYVTRSLDIIDITTDRPRPTSLLPPRSSGKPEVTTAVDKLLWDCEK